MRRPACDHKRHTLLKATEIITGRRAADFRPRSEIDWRAEKCHRCQSYRIITVHGEAEISPEVRALVLRRDRCRCVRCGVRVQPGRYSLGHRVRAGQGGQPVPSNLLTFCGLGGELCHGAVDFRRDPADEAKGYSLRSHQDPAQVSVMIFEEDGSGVSRYAWDDGTWQDRPQNLVAA